MCLSWLPKSFHPPNSSGLPKSQLPCIYHRILPPEWGYRRFLGIRGLQDRIVTYVVASRTAIGLAALPRGPRAIKLHDDIIFAVGTSGFRGCRGGAICHLPALVHSVRRTVTIIPSTRCALTSIRLLRTGSGVGVNVARA